MKYAQPFYHTCLTNGVQFKDGGGVFLLPLPIYICVGDISRELRPRNV